MKWLFVIWYLAVLALMSVETAGQTLTISPISFTYHATSDKQAEAKFETTVDGAKTTVHPGLTLLLQGDNWQGAAWIFKDSFGNPAGGIMSGPKTNFSEYFSIGVVGGVYAREREPGIKPFGISAKTETVEVAPMAGATVSIAVPLHEKRALEVNCMSNYILTNCGFGLRIGF